MKKQKIIIHEGHKGARRKEKEKPLKPGISTDYEEEPIEPQRRKGRGEKQQNCNHESHELNKSTDPSKPRINTDFHGLKKNLFEPQVIRNGKNLL